ncbi:putative membrane protein [Angulomicrobium tetraedrale]|uniref:Putative membrane protein n=1 Tax=Ancylobacter tetraedralis TaxID=217068 RepID=A0A839Z930_9HYPH|nr:DUF599 domain-containing protein [Ancylobacter tetraedralis]MBB3771118.1 putative membrane protein [Ancylobacter tetraedralis]
MLGFTALDGLAFAAFLAAWAAYHQLMEGEWAERRSFNRRMDLFRLEWMQRMLARENRIVDAQIVAALQNGTAFFASTSLLAIGGTLAILQSTDAVMAIFMDLPFVTSNRSNWELKTLGLTLIFANAFFKFAWAYRLFNYTTILLGSTPPPAEAGSAHAHAHVLKVARMVTLAGRHFNRGQRSFFFAIAYLGWYVNAWAFMAATTAIFIVMTNRQFGRDAHWVLDDGDPDPLAMSRNAGIHRDNEPDAS